MGVCGRSVGCVVSSRNVVDWVSETVTDNVVRLRSDPVFGIFASSFGDVELEREVVLRCCED